MGLAHSLGALTTLRVLARQPEPWTLGGLVLVSGFAELLPALPELDDYLAADVPAERLAKHIGTRAMVRSDDDPLVPPAASDALAQRLDAKVHVQPGAGHFLAEDGVTTLPCVLDLMRD